MQEDMGESAYPAGVFPPWADARPGSRVTHRYVQVKIQCKKYNYNALSLIEFRFRL